MLFLTFTDWEAFAALLLEATGLGARSGHLVTHTRRPPDCHTPHAVFTVALLPYEAVAARQFLRRLNT